MRLGGWCAGEATGTGGLRRRETAPGSKGWLPALLIAAGCVAGACKSAVQCARQVAVTGGAVASVQSSQGSSLAGIVIASTIEPRSLSQPASATLAWPNA